ncbi:MAG: protein kinase domain-containing protein [Candidatus Eiseniibacteriota bacterium]
MEQIEAGARIGHYEILGKIGAGGMGEVYRARDLKLERPVAVKFLPAWAASDATATERLVREAKLASSLNHPHIVTIYAIEESDSLPFLVMEYVEGETLRQRLARKPLEVAELAAIGAEVADALESAHRVGLIHRDVKSSNILLTNEGHAKVVDFGLAKRVASAGQDPEGTVVESLTATGALVGTAAYMSPEQTRGELLDARTDLFSLGVVLYEAATGRLPFEGPSMLSVLHEIALVEPPAPSRARPGLPRTLDQVLLRAMAKDKARRYATAAELAAALRALARDDSGIEGGTAEIAAVAASRVPNNLPVSLTSFVGRRDEMEEIARLLDTARLVTLTGAGGCGKSRLSVQVARNVLEGYPEGAWIAELAPLSDSSLVTQRVAAAAGVREEPGRALAETLRDALRDRTALILLDNCEHVTAACRALASDLLEAAPRVRVLATSREPLGIPGEAIWRVPPLHVPDLRGPGRHTRRELGRSESVRLFAERAAAASPAFSLTDQNAEAVAQICARVDGIPLAIELAAARVKVLPPAQILSRLQDRFRLLTSGSPTALQHQQTLRAAVEWSYEMLTEKERALFNRLSVFAGGASLEAVETVCAGDGLDEADILDLVSHLSDKSLVLPEEGIGGAARYRLLETLREYGKECLQNEGRRAAAQERHARHFIALAEGAEPELNGEGQSQWLARLEEEHDNLREAGDWAVRAGRVAEALQFTGALWRFWRIHCHFGEGRRRLEAALALPVDGAPTQVLRVKAFLGAGALARSQSDYERARALLEEGLALGRTAGERNTLSAILLELGNVADDQGSHEDARAYFEECLALRRAAGDKRGSAVVLHNLGVVSQALGDYDGAWFLYGESLAINREIGNEGWEALDLNALGSVALDHQDYASAWRQHEEALAIHRHLGDRWGIAYSLHEMGRAAIWLGDRAKAFDLLQESVTIFQDLGDRVGVVETLEHFAALAASESRDERALVLAGAAAALRESLGAPQTPPDRASMERLLAPPKERLGSDRSATAFHVGRATSLDRAIAMATQRDP